MEQNFNFPASLSPSLIATHYVSAQRTYVLEKLCQEEGSWIAVASGAELRFLRYFLCAFPHLQKRLTFLLDLKWKLNA